MPTVTLIHCPAVKLVADGDNLGAVRTHFPKISQLTLAAIVRRACPDADVRVVDMKVGGTETKVREIAYGKQTIEVFRVGRRLEDLAGDVLAADVLVFTSNFTQEAAVVGDVIAFARRLKPDVKVWIGGSDAMVRRLEVDRPRYFRGRGADVVAEGDGELLLPALLGGARELGRATLEDMDAVPDPALDLADLPRYTESHEGGLPQGAHPPLMYLETSRGCRQSCDFCATPFTKGRYRFMSQPRIEALLARYRAAGIRTLLLIEDNILSRLDFPGGREAVLRWFRHMRERDFTWEFANGVEIGKLERNGVLDEELIDALFAWEDGRGCFRSYVPLERIDPGPLAYRKLKTFDVQRRTLEAITDQRVPLLNLGVIIGNPQETPQSLAVTEARMVELREAILERSHGRTFPFANFFLHIPICGTNDYRRFHAEGRLTFDIDTDPELYNFYTSILRGDYFAPAELTALRREIAARVNGPALFHAWTRGGKYYPDHFEPAAEPVPSLG